jgi:hypothetical protein
LELGDKGGGPVAVPLDEAKKLIAKSDKGEHIDSLSQFAIQELPDEVSKTYSNVVGQDDLTRFDEAKRKKSRSAGKNMGGNRNKRKDHRRGSPKPQSSK